MATDPTRPTTWTD